jgi:hypothetical protein
MVNNQFNVNAMSKTRNLAKYTLELKMEAVHQTGAGSVCLGKSSLQ